MKENKDFLDYYTIINTIGEGIGTIYKVEKKETKEKRAIKVIDKKNINPKVIINEIKNMKISEGKNKQNKNTVKYYECFENNEEIALVMELCDEDLLSLLAKKDKFEPSEILNILSQLNNTFKIMNENKIMYKDLKLGNILLKYENEEKTKYIIKLKLNCGDIIIPINSSLVNSSYNNRFICPEILKNENTNAKCDLWSLGIIIYVLLFKKYPYMGEDEEEILDDINDKGQKFFEKSGNADLDDLIRKLLVEDPSKRLSWEEYFNHPFMKRDFKKYYDIMEQIDEGDYGKIYKAKEIDTGEYRAIKKFDKNRIRTEFMKQNLRPPTEEEIKKYNDSFFNEMNYMKLIEGKNHDNKNAVKVYEYFDNKEEFIIVMELCDCNLLQFFARKNETFNIKEIHELLTQLNNSFRLMAENKLIHRALNLQNILLKFENEQKTKYTAKLKINEKSCLNATNISNSKIVFQNIKMIPPEVLNGKQYNQKSDLWSLGLIIYVLLFRKYPYTSNNEISLLEEIKNNGQTNFMKTNDSDLDNLILKLLTVDPDKRINWNQYFNHPFFNNKNQEEILILNDDYKKYYEIQNKIGNGSFGIVYKAIKKDTKEKRAVKIFDKEMIRNNIRNQYFREPSEQEMKTYIDSLINEIKNMKLVESKNKDYENVNTVKFYECFNTKDEFVIVMELCDENLTDIITKKNEPYSVGEIKGILIQLNNSFKIMFKNKLVHRDLKLQNILVKYEDNNKITLKLTDYGLSKKLLTLSKKFSTVAGTMNFMAPEIIKSEKYNDECDLWSLGVMIYILSFKCYPYEGQTESDILNQIKNLNSSNLRKTQDKDLNNLISSLLIEDPKERITWEGYFNHKFFSNSTEPIFINKTESGNKNFIIIKLKIGEKNINKEIYFLEKENKEHIHINELNDTNCQIYINNEQCNFNRYFKPSKIGEYEIKLIFLDKINNSSYMFNGCKSIISIDLSNFDSSDITDMNSMFSECTHLKKIILENLNTEKVNNMNYMFNKCLELEKIEFPNSFNTQNVKNLSFMFHDCENLSEIIFSSSFKTDNAINFKAMFGKCHLLKKLDLRNFSSEKVKDMSYMFDQCNNLIEILIEPELFKTNNVTHMNYMFSDCFSLKSFDFSLFNTEKVKFMNYMLNNCRKITKVDFRNSNINKDTNLTFMFNECNNLEVINISSFDITNNNKIDNMFENSKNIKKIIVNKRSIEKFQNTFKNLINLFSTN